MCLEIILIRLAQFLSPPSLHAPLLCLSLRFDGTLHIQTSDPDKQKEGFYLNKKNTFFLIIFGGHLLLIYQQPLIGPLDDKESIEGDAEVLVVNLRDVLDVDAHVHHSPCFIGKVEFGVVFRDAD